PLPPVPPVGTGPRVRVEPQFALPAAPGAEVWLDMTQADVCQAGTRALTLGQHTFVWNTVVDLGDFTGKILVRVLASYEPTESIQRTFRVRSAELTIDNRRTA